MAKGVIVMILKNRLFMNVRKQVTLPSLLGVTLEGLIETILIVFGMLLAY